MIVSRPVFEKAQKETLDMLDGACEQTPEDFMEYWEKFLDEIPLCELFGSSGDYCNGCPISRKKNCSKLLYACDEAYWEDDLPAFHRNARALRRKIRHLDHDKYVERAKKLGLGD